MEVVDWNQTEAEVLFVPKTLEETQAEVVLLTERNEYEERRWQAVEEILGEVQTGWGTDRAVLKSHMASFQTHGIGWLIEDKVLKLAGLWPRGK